MTWHWKANGEGRRDRSVSFINTSVDVVWASGWGRYKLLARGFVHRPARGPLRFWLPEAVAKNRSSRWVYLPAALARKVGEHCAADRGEIMAAARRRGSLRAGAFAATVSSARL